MTALVQLRPVERRIFVLRGVSVMLDEDLAELYGVETKALNRAVRRNRERFPSDFLFQVTAAEAADLRRHSGTSSSHGGRRYRPWAFTEQGVAGLSGVLRSSRAAQVHVEIMRAFVRLRVMALSYVELARKVQALERRYDGKFKLVFEALRRLMAPPEPARERIGFRGTPE